MTSRDLNPQQLEQLGRQVGRRLRWLNRLIDRMTKRGFAGNDPMFQAALRAHDGMHWLGVAVHYAGCRSGVAGAGDPSSTPASSDTSASPER